MTTLIHTDRSLAVTVDPSREAWAPSPEPGVERIMLERDGGEVARATTLVRYAPAAGFAWHVHELGEELLVLGGELRDEHGVYPRGTYVRNPRGSSHAPSSPEGCLLFVKLRQIGADERERRVASDVFGEAARAIGGEHLLHVDASERVEVRRLVPHRRVVLGDGVREVLVIEGELIEGDARHQAGTWLRRPRGQTVELSSRTGCLLWSKTAAR